MDPSGLAVGVVGLASIVSSCIEAFRIVKSIRSFDHDAEIILLKLEIERDLFIQWAYNAGLLKKHYVNASLFNPKRDHVIHDVLEKIQQLLGEAEVMARKYGLIQEEAWRTDFDCEDKARKGWCSCNRHSSRHRHRDDSSSPSPIQAMPRKVSLSRKFVWTVHAKEEFQGLINELHYFIERLYQMVKSVEQRRTMMRDLRGVGADFSKLSLIDGGSTQETGEDSWSDVMSVFSDGDSGVSDSSGRSRRNRSEKRERSRRRRESRGGQERGESTRAERKSGDFLEVPRLTDGRNGSSRSRRHSGGSYERPPSYVSVYGDLSSSSRRSSRITVAEMVDDVVGPRGRSKSDLR